MPMLSYSAISRYKSCPKKYELSTKWKEKTVSSALHFGTAVEAGVEAMLKGANFKKAYAAFLNKWEFEDGDKNKPIKGNTEIEFYASDYDKALLKCHSDIPESVLGSDWEKVYDNLSKAIKKEIRLDDEDLVKHNIINWESLALKAKYMLKAFEKEILPDVKLDEIDGKPATQSRIFLKISESKTRKTSNKGFVDFVVKVKDIDLPVIIDCKTSADFYDEHKLLTSSQLKTYVAALKMQTGKEYLSGYWVLLKKMKYDKKCRVCGWVPPTALNKHCKECSAKNCIDVSPVGQTQFTIVEFDDYSTNDLIDDIKLVDKGIENSIFFKNESACMDFNRKCAFYDICWKGADPKDLEHLLPKGKKK